MGLRDKIKEAIEEFDWINDIDSKVEEESIDILDSDEEMVDLAQDTVTLINNEIDAIEEVQDKTRMKKLIEDLYMESLSL